MIVIRLFRTGKKNQPFFRLVVTDKRKPPRSGRFIEILGFYNPLTKERLIKKERVEYWLSQGAKASDTVHNLLVKEGVLKTDKIPVHKKRKKKEEKSEEKPKEEPKKEEKPKEEPKKEEKPKEEPKKEEKPKEEPKKEEKPKEEPKKEEKPKEEPKKEEEKN